MKEFKDSRHASSSKQPLHRYPSSAEQNSCIESRNPLISQRSCSCSSVSFLFQFLFQRIVEHLPRMLCLRNERVNVSEGQTRRPEPFLLDLRVGIHSHLSEAMKNAVSPTW